jgi:hypothetical protein
MSTTNKPRSYYVNLWRRALAGLSYDNVGDAKSFKALAPSLAAAILESRGLVPNQATWSQWVAALYRVTMPCRRCAGTGQFITYVENGKPRGPGGICFRCDGKGRQNHRDGHRNRAWDKHAFEHACQAMMAPPRDWHDNEDAGDLRMMGAADASEYR